MRIDAARLAAQSPEELRLRNVANQMEGVFMSHLMRALRETKPDGGLIDGGAGEEMFTSMFDEHVAQLAAGKQDGSIGAMLYRQLRARLGSGTP